MPNWESRGIKPCAKFANAEILDVNGRKFIAGALGTVCVPFAVETQQTGKGQFWRQDNAGNGSGPY